MSQPCAPPAIGRRTRLTSGCGVVQIIFQEPPQSEYSYCRVTATHLKIRYEEDGNSRGMQNYSMEGEYARRLCSYQLELVLAVAAVADKKLPQTHDGCHRQFFLMLSCVTGAEPELQQQFVVPGRRPNRIVAQIFHFLTGL